MTVILVTATTVPRPDRESLLLIEALAAHDVHAELRKWDEDGTDWQAAELILLRSPWNYDEKADAFQRWLALAGAAGRLWNPLELISWNIRKSYLLDLEARGVGIVPTQLVHRGSKFDAASCSVGPDGRMVAKPVIGAGARGAVRGRPTDAAVQQHIRVMLEEHDMLIQPYVTEIAEGERSLIYFEGRFSHAVIKTPRASDWRVQAQYGAATSAYMPTSAEHALAEAALAAAPSASLYARVDMVTAGRGPMLMELEMIEPELFLPLAPGSAERLAEAVVRRL